MAITGQRVSPPLFETMQILGRDVVLARMKTAVALLKALPASAE
jgi:glutamyl/glutaminyl-tRNA synthetase